MQTLLPKPIQNDSLTSFKYDSLVVDEPEPKPDPKPRCLASLPANIDELIALFQKQGTQVTGKQS